MIKVTTLNNSEIYVNAELIEILEKTPDTIITLTTEKKIIVRETIDEIVTRVIEYKRRINNSNFSSVDLEEQSN